MNNYIYPKVHCKYVYTLSGADIEVADVDSYTPLMTAAAYGQTQAFKRLLDRGAHTDVLDKEGKSIVFLAAKYNHVAILRVCVYVTSL